MPETLEKFDILPLQYENINDLKNDYLVYSFSVFDHWLTETEFCNEIVNYHEISKLKNKKKSSKYFNHEQKISDFYIKLYNTVECYGIFLDNFSRCVFVKYDSENEFKNHIKLGIREEIGLTIIIPELGSVLSSGHDLTHQLYILHSYSAKAKIIFDYIKRYNLHILL